ncbi:phage portal protein, lambda family, partial [Salinihabitans flavidus]
MPVPLISNKARRAKAALRNPGMGGGASYIAGDPTVETLASFNPPQRAADAEVLGARDKITSRARDLARNNGWAAGGIAKEVDAVIGANFRPILKPDWKALGLDPEWAAEFKAQIEARWRAYAEDPRKMADVTRAQTVPQMFGTAYRTYLTEGEALALVAWRRRRATHTTLRIVDPDLLCNPGDTSDTPYLRGGIGLSKHGAAVRYYFRQGHRNQGWSDARDYTWKAVARERRTGRPQVLHFFDKLRDGQTRGVSRLAPIIEKLRMEDHYSRV